MYLKFSPEILLQVSLGFLLTISPRILLQFRSEISSDNLSEFLIFSKCSFRISSRCSSRIMYGVLKVFFLKFLWNLLFDFQSSFENSFENSSGRISRNSSQSCFFLHCSETCTENSYRSFSGILSKMSLGVDPEVSKVIISEEILKIPRIASENVSSLYSSRDFSKNFKKKK